MNSVACQQASVNDCDNPPSRLVWNHDLVRQPSRFPLVENFLSLGELGWLYGPPGCFKTFAGLDLALSVATGRRGVFGAPHEPSRVVYLLAEGSEGLRERIEAWEETHGRLPERAVAFQPTDVNLLDVADVTFLIEDVQRNVHAPFLFVLDPLADFLGGEDENSPRVMLSAIRSLKRLRNEFGAAVLVIAHCGHDGRHERGHSSQQGAADIRLSFAAKGDDRVTVTWKKRRHEAKPPPFTLHRRIVGASCVLERGGAAEAEERVPSGDARKALALLAGGGLRAGEWQERSGAPERTFFRWRKDLIAEAYATKDGGNVYVLTPRGRDLLDRHEL